jgi:hypothetical protein
LKPELVLALFLEEFFVSVWIVVYFVGFAGVLVDCFLYFWLKFKIIGNFWLNF